MCNHLYHYELVLWNFHKILNVLEIIDYLMHVTNTNSLDCYTNGGPDSNKPCVFPFIYNGIEYTACTTVENDGIAWCSTEVDVLNGSYVEGKWGNCGPGCSGGNEVHVHIIYIIII